MTQKTGTPSNILLYATTVLVWGVTWLGIKLQLEVVDPMVSVTYRFALAAAILILYCRYRCFSMRFSLQQHAHIALQGMFLFSLNYLLIYLSEEWLTSGLVAVVFSSVMFMSIFNEALIFGTLPHATVVLGGVLGMAGIGTVFWPEIASLRATSDTLTGLVLAILGTFSASLGMITSAHNQRRGLPVLQTNALGMCYGAALMAGLTIVLGRQFSIQPTVSYIGSLIYLAVFGSVVGFGAYLTLVGRIGPGRAAYSTLLVPLVALVISWAFEGYDWTWFTLIGVVLIIGGNMLVLNPRS